MATGVKSLAVYAKYLEKQRHATSKRSRQPGYYHGDVKSMYQTKWWKAVTKKWKEMNPICSMCKRNGKATPVDVVDHKIPHRGNPVLFFNWGNLQSLCYFHHNSIKAHHERQAKLQTSNDGW